MLLNPEQQEAVGHMHGACVVSAVPGSGKTRVLTERVAELIQSGISPDTILCLTFTNKAAREMKNRVQQRVGEQAGRVWISTFHSMCAKLLRTGGQQVGLKASFSIYDSDDQEDLLRQVARRLELESFGAGDAKLIAEHINRVREDMEDLDGLSGILTPEQAKVAKHYLLALDKLNAVDFSGLLYKTWQLFQQCPHVPQALGNKFTFVMVDEAQDTNAIQYEIVRQIAHHGNFFMVGDFDQSIYSWRGARPENLVKITKDFPGCRGMTLPRNYRSTRKILGAAQSLIRNNQNAIDVTLVGERNDAALPVLIQSCCSEASEADYVVSEIQRLTADGSFAPDQIVILYRLNAMSRQFEMALRNAGIKYRIVGGFSFFDRKEVKLAVSYLTLLVNPLNTIAFAKAVGYPSRSIGDTRVGKIEGLALDRNASVFDVCTDPLVTKGMSVVAKDKLTKFAAAFRECAAVAGTLPLDVLAEKLFVNTGFWRAVQEESRGGDYSKNRLDNLKEFLRSLAEFERANPGVTLDDYLQTLMLISTEAQESDSKGVTLMTMHAAKGLEFPCVYIVGAERNINPHWRAVKDCGNDHEERRLFYVAMTRAKDRLSISYCETRMRRGRFGQESYETSRSPFLEEIACNTECVRICQDYGQ